ncbi:hypothetical protein D0T08_14605 [Emticicia sp. C21]|nr:hypothetical protein D0T08_14605 [Emticicia sp. C21]
MDKDWASPKYQGFWEFVRRGKEWAVQKVSEKVTNVVGTFLNKGSNRLLVPPTHTKPKKVTNMVGTFCQRTVMISRYQPLIRNQKSYQYGENLFARG